MFITVVKSVSIPIGFDGISLLQFFTENWILIKTGTRRSKTMRTDWTHSTCLTNGNVTGWKNRNECRSWWNTTAMDLFCAAYSSSEKREINHKNGSKSLPSKYSLNSSHIGINSFSSIFHSHYRLIFNQISLNLEVYFFFSMLSKILS